MVKVQNVWNVNRIQFVTYKSKSLLVYLYFGNLILFYFICLNPQYLWSIFLKKRYILECMIRCGGCLSIGKYIHRCATFSSSVYLYWSYILPTFYYPLHWLECTKWRVKQLLVRKEVSFCRSHNKPFSLNRNVKPRHSVRYYIFQYDFETATLSKIID